MIAHWMEMLGQPPNYLNGTEDVPQATVCDRTAWHLIPNNDDPIPKSNFRRSTSNAASRGTRWKALRSHVKLLEPAQCRSGPGFVSTMRVPTTDLGTAIVLVTQ
jgi:hypothetical protein